MRFGRGKLSLCVQEIDANQFGKLLMFFCQVFFDFHRIENNFEVLFECRSLYILLYYCLRVLVDSEHCSIILMCNQGETLCVII